MAGDFTIGVLKKFAAGKPIGKRQLDELVTSGYVTTLPDGTHEITTAGAAALTHS